MKGFVYDVGPNKGGSELFTKTTREIAKYVATNYIGASDFRNGMVDLNLQPVRPPTDPTDPHDQVAFEKWKRAYATYERQYEERRKLAGRVFSLVIGQCTQGMRDVLEASQSWSSINDSDDVIELLKLIKISTYNQTTRKKDVLAMIQAEERFVKFKQGNLSNAQFLEKFKDLF